MKKIISLIVACILLLTLWACSDTPTLVDSSSDNQTNSDTPKIDENTTFSLGDTVELDNVHVTFVDLIENKGTTYFKPESGNIFVLCEFEIVNDSNENINVSSILNFEAYCDDYTCDYSISALSAKSDKKQLDGTVAPGKKMKGVVGYEVPKDWKELEIHYTLGVLDNTEIIFVATNS